MKVEASTKWDSDCKVMIKVTSTLVQSHLQCWVSDVHISGILTMESSPLVAQMPPFKNVRLYFRQKPLITLKLKFKDTTVSRIKTLRNSSIGAALSSALQARLIEEMTASMLAPRSLTIELSE